MTSTYTGRLVAGVDAQPQYGTSTAGDEINLSDVRGTVLFPDHPSAAKIKVDGVHGRGPLRFIGERSADTVTTGSASGAAGAGSSTTSVVIPDGADDWTEDDLIGKWAYFPSLSGALRPITANTTEAFTVAALTGLEEGVAFEIVTLDSSFTDVIRFGDSTCAIELVGFTLDAADVANLVRATDCRRVTLRGCAIASNTSSPSVSVEDCAHVALEYCMFTDAADALITGASKVSITGCYVASGGGTISVEDADKVTVTELLAFEPASYALRLVRCRYASVEAQCDDGDASAFYFEDCGRLVASGTLLTGTGNAEYGIEIEGGGRYSLVGCDVEGTTGDVLFLGNAVTWANLGGETYGIVEEHAGNAVGNANYNQALKYGNYLYMGNAFYSGRLLMEGVLNFSQVGALTATGTDADTALALTQYTVNLVGTVASGTGVKMPLAATVSRAGVPIIIRNGGANALKVYPVTGGTINGGASVEIAAGVAVLFLSTSDDDWVTLGAVS